MIVRRNVPTRVNLAKNRFSAITRPFLIRFDCDLLLTFSFFQLNTMMITMRAIHQLFTVKNVLATSDCCEIMCNVHDLYSYYSVSRQSLLISCYNHYYTINHNLTIKGPAIYPQEFPKGTQFSTVIDSAIFIVRELVCGPMYA